MSIIIEEVYSHQSERKFAVSAGSVKFEISVAPPRPEWTFWDVDIEHIGGYDAFGAWASGGHEALSLAADYFTNGAYIRSTAWARIKDKLEEKGAFELPM